MSGLWILEHVNKAILTREEEQELMRAYKDRGDRRARDILVERNQRFVLSLATKYNVTKQFSLEDLVQEGTLGLMEAIERFDPDRGWKLVTYARWWIAAYQISHTHRFRRMVRVDTTHENRKLLAVLPKMVRQLQKDGVPSTERDEILAKMTGSTREKVRLIQQYFRPDKSLDTPVSEDNDTPLVSLYADPDAHYKVTAQVEEDSRREFLNRRVEELLPHERWKKIIRRRYVDGEKQASIGREVGVSRQRIQQIESMALDVLRVAAEEENWKEAV